jgi:16S rRNA (guanine527-N7)-methyltransferase
LPESQNSLNDDPSAAAAGEEAGGAGGDGVDSGGFDAAGYRSELAAALDEAFGDAAPAPEQRDRLLSFGTLLADRARLFNLTRLTAPMDMAVQHFLDTHFLARFIHPAVTTVLDIGTGAGVPGIPLAILKPELLVTLIDGTGKKARFVQESIDALGLGNARAMQARAEEHLHKNRYHAGVLRASVKPVRMMEILSETRSPLGSVVFMLGSDGPRIARSLKSRRYKLTRLEPYRLPGRDKERYIAVFRKRK